jgi:hypothetical protein
MQSDERQKGQGTELSVVIQLEARERREREVPYLDNNREGELRCVLLCDLFGRRKRTVLHFTSLM